MTDNQAHTDTTLDNKVNDDNAVSTAITLDAPKEEDTMEE